MEAENGCSHGNSREIGAEIHKSYAPATVVPQQIFKFPEGKFSGAMWWVDILLMLMVIVLLGVMLFGRGGVIRQKKLERELEELKQKLAYYQRGQEPPASLHPSLFDFVRDLESLRSAIAGSKISERSLYKKYRLHPGPRLLEKILIHTKLGPSLKERLADEFLVGEVGRGLMKALERGFTIERAAAEVGVPLVVAKGQIRRLQILGYLDGALKPTETGWRALRT